jgi:hypothetical protein
MAVEIKGMMAPPTDMDVLRVERALGFKLNKSYIDSVEKYNGAKFEDNVFNIGDNGINGIHRFIPFNEILNCYDIFCNQCGKYLVPIADCYCGDIIFISNRYNDGMIYYLDHEDPSGAALTLIAPSLAEFLKGIQPDRSRARLEPGQVKSVWVHPDLLKMLKDKAKKS